MQLRLTIAGFVAACAVVTGAGPAAAEDSHRESVWIGSAPAAVLEGDSMPVVVTRSSTKNLARVTVHAPGGDQAVTLRPGETSAVVTIPTLEDNIAERDAVVVVSITADHAVLGAPASVAVTVADEDGTSDTDGDLLSNLVEVLAGLDPFDPDQNANGVPDGRDVNRGRIDPGSDARFVDADGDRMAASFEARLGTSDDNVDSDGDGLWEFDEIFGIGSHPVLADGDGDGLDDGDEYAYRLSAFDPDTDDDGLSDGDEVALGTNGRAPDSDRDGLLDGEDPEPRFDGPGDQDDDGLSGFDERNLGTDPERRDTDSDGLGDGEELEIGTDPLDLDTDGDLVSDHSEVELLGTDPLDADTDDDGLTDFEELGFRYAFRSDPLDPDTDDDGFDDRAEMIAGTDPQDPAWYPGGPPPAADPGPDDNAESTDSDGARSGSDRVL